MTTQFRKVFLNVAATFSILALFAAYACAVDLETTDGQKFDGSTLDKISAVGVRFQHNGKSRFIGINDLTEKSRQAVKDASAKNPGLVQIPVPQTPEKALQDAVLRINKTMAKALMSMKREYLKDPRKYAKELDDVDKEYNKLADTDEGKRIGLAPITKEDRLVVGGWEMKEQGNASNHSMSVVFDISHEAVCIDSSNPREEINAKWAIVEGKLVISLNKDNILTVPLPISEAMDCTGPQNTKWTMKRKK